MNQTLISFLGLRIIRLIPALAIDTSISALIIGPIFTSLALKDYFAHPQFWTYWRNIIGEIQFNLPGVFTDNPTTAVNAQLWTLPFELLCYASITGLALFGIARDRRAFLAATALAVLVNFAWSGLYHQTIRPTTVGPAVLVESFLIGVCLFLYRDRVNLRSWLLVLSVVASWLCFTVPFGDNFAAIPATYLVVHLGLMNPPRIKLVSSGDYSYGIFLYGYPIQQTVYSILPTMSWPGQLVVSFIGIFALAVFSWWCVEAPALKLRPYLYAFEARAIVWLNRLPFGSHLTRPPAKSANDLHPRITVSTSQGAA